MTTLSINFWMVPNSATQTVTAKEMRDIFIQTDGRILAKGYFRDICYKKMCPGVYELFLKPLSPPPDKEK